ncbi:MAG TPA: DUF2589 domain-containing protein [Anaeromyxobacteraceae bacterium]|nr:DUF2589 domain-containing protein [Anaeromyxobacteraceae bacterium]
MPGTIDTTPSTVATNALQAIPYSALIGGPLDACIKAQATSAMTTVDFIRKVGFRQNPTTKEDEVVNVVFQYVADGQTFNIIVPLLAIVPIPYIGIDDISIDFKANISAESSSVNEETTNTTFGGEASGGLSLGFGPFSLKVDFKANYSSKKDSKATQSSKYSVEYTMDVHVGASQADMPAGLAKVLNILESKIMEVNARGRVDVLPQTLTMAMANGSTATVQMRVLGGQGLPPPPNSVQVTTATAGFSAKATALAGDPGIWSVEVKVESAENAKKAPALVLDVAYGGQKRQLTLPIQTPPPELPAHG